MPTNINADNGVVSGIAGLKTSADNSGVLALQTNGTTGLTVNASQALGVGSTPSFGTAGQVLTSAGSSAPPTWSSAGGATPAGSNTQIQYNNAGAFGASANLTYGSNVLTSTGRIQIYNTSGTDGGFLRISSTGDVKYYDFEVTDSTGLAIQQNGDTRLTINNDGNIKLFNNISVGNVTPTTSGTGITFPATQSASSDANTLDDYEEGSWTPADGSGAGLSITFYNATYVKIGQMVYAQCSIIYPSTANTAGTQVNGLPYTANSTGFWGGSMRYTTYTGFVMSATAPSATNFALYTTNGTQLLNANASGYRFDCVFMYRASA